VSSAEAIGRTRRCPASIRRQSWSRIEKPSLIREYHGLVRISRRVFQRLLPQQPTTERCVEGYYLQRTRFESIAERKLRRRQLTEEGNVEIRICARCSKPRFAGALPARPDEERGARCRATQGRRALAANRGPIHRPCIRSRTYFSASSG